MTARVSGGGRVWRVRGVAALTAVALVLSGCVTTTAQMEQQLGIAAVAADDPCGAQSLTLREAKGHFERGIVQGVVVGAVAGALIGGILGGGRGMAHGALAGAALGGATGYFAKRQQEAADRAALVGTVTSDFHQHNAEITRALVAFNQVRACRTHRAQSIKADFAAGRLVRSQAEAMLATERSRFADDIAVARYIGAKVGEQQQEFDQAAQQLALSSPGAMQLYSNVRETSTRALTASERVPTVVTGKPYRTSAAVNVRAEPSASAARLDRLAEGARVTELERAENGWSRILAGDVRGWVATRYLTDKQPKKQDAAPAEPAPAAWTVLDAPEPGQSELAQALAAAPTPGDAESRAVLAHYEGVEKRIELNQALAVATAEEQTLFELN